MNTTATIGHNQPPSEIDLLKERLSQVHKPDIDAARDLVKDAGDQIKNTQITDDQVCADFSDLAKKLGDTYKNIEALRVKEKAPFDAQASTVQSFFKIIVDTLDNTKRSVLSKVGDYQREQSRIKQAELAEQARIQREEAGKKLNTAVEMEDAGLKGAAEHNMAQAQSSINQAERLEVQSQAKPSKLSQVRGSSSLASLRTVWKGHIVDAEKLDLEKLRPFLILDLMAMQKAVNAYVKQGGRDLEGVKIFEESTATVR